MSVTDTAVTPTEEVPEEVPEADAAVGLYSNHIDAPVAVQAGTTILVTNFGSGPHDVVDADGSFETRRLATNEWELLSIETPGTYALKCSLHPIDMRATLEVTDGPPPAPPEPPEGTVPVLLVDYDVVVPATIPSGSTLTIENIGDQDHDLRVEELDTATPVLGPGDAGELVLDTPGTYLLVCTLHENTMRRNVTVT